MRQGTRQRARGEAPGDPDELWKVHTGKNTSDVETKPIPQDPTQKHRTTMGEVTYEEAMQDRCPCEECPCPMFGAGACNAAAGEESIRSARASATQTTP